MVFTGVLFMCDSSVCLHVKNQIGDSPSQHLTHQLIFGQIKCHRVRKCKKAIVASVSYALIEIIRYTTSYYTHWDY